MTTGPYLGIDVGGARKGYHLAILSPDNRVSVERIPTAAAVAARCLALAPAAIAIDAPCGWAAGESRSREAERALARRGIRAYATPARHLAQLGPRGFHAWMLQGESLFAALRPHYPLWTDPATPPTGPCCFETFPHAITCALRGEIVIGKNKAADRPALLAAHHIQLPPGSPQDDIDAALCALAARYIAAGDADSYGNPTEGHVVTPRWRTTSAPVATATTAETEAAGFAKMNLPAARRHAFLCLGPDCCAAATGEASWATLKALVKQLDLPVLRTKAACLRVCAGGPWLVVYPEGTWYGRVTPERLTRIAHEHLRDGHPVTPWISRTHPLPGRAGLPPGTS
jgi:(2Fe-2S) ferredoxin/predicted nuclease with RNAse H fold